jgi:hypothetical protein
MVDELVGQKAVWKAVEKGLSKAVSLVSWMAE